jgi:hypothetical protein
MKFEDRKFGEWVGREVATPSGKFGHFRNWINVEATRLDRRHGSHSCQICDIRDIGYWIVTRESVASGNKLSDVMCEGCAKSWLSETSGREGLLAEQMPLFVTDRRVSYEEWRERKRGIDANQQ